MELPPHCLAEVRRHSQPRPLHRSPVLLLRGHSRVCRRIRSQKGHNRRDILDTPNRSSRTTPDRGKNLLRDALHALRHSRDVPHALRHSHDGSRSKPIRHHSPRLSRPHETQAASSRSCCRCSAEAPCDSYWRPPAPHETPGLQLHARKIRHAIHPVGHTPGEQRRRPTTRRQKDASHGYRTPVRASLAAHRHPRWHRIAPNFAESNTLKSACLCRTRNP